MLLDSNAELTARRLLPAVLGLALSFAEAPLAVPSLSLLLLLGTAPVELILSTSGALSTSDVLEGRRRDVGADDGLDGDLLRSFDAPPKNFLSLAPSEGRGAELPWLDDFDAFGEDQELRRNGAAEAPGLPEGGIFESPAFECSGSFAVVLLLSSV